MKFVYPDVVGASQKTKETVFFIISWTIDIYKLQEVYFTKSIS